MIHLFYLMAMSFISYSAYLYGKHKAQNAIYSDPDKWFDPDLDPVDEKATPILITDGYQVISQVAPRYDRSGKMRMGYYYDKPVTAWRYFPKPPKNKEKKNEES